MIQEILTADQRAKLEVRLAEAEDSYHSLQTQQAARVVVDQNGERVEFTATNSAKLAAYIRQLQMQLASPCDVARALAPASFIF